MRCDDWELNRALKMLTDYTLSYYESLFIVFKFNAALFKNWCYRKYITDQIGSSGHSYSVRIAENGGSGSFTYYNSKNGVMCNVNFRYNKDTQNPKDVVGMLVGALNWIANSNQSEYLSMYSKFGFSINVDVSRTGKELGKIFGYKFCAGVSKNDWRYFDAGFSSYADYNEKEAAKLESGWIYIASEYLDEKYYSKDYSYDIIGQTGVLNYDKESFYNSSMIFSHEFKHNFDSIFMFCPVFRETSARLFTKNVTTQPAGNGQFL
jgi:hypothetical protein